MGNKRGAVSVFIILGIALLVFIAFLITINFLYYSDKNLDNSIPVRINNYITSCMNDPVKEAIQKLESEGGYILNESNLTDGFRMAKLYFNNQSVPVYIYNNTPYVIESYPSDLEKVKSVPDYPCLKEDDACNLRTFLKKNNIPFGKGEVGDFELTSSPGLVLYTDQKQGNKISVQEQLEKYIDDQVRECVINLINITSDFNGDIKLISTDSVTTVEIGSHDINIFYKPEMSIKFGNKEYQYDGVAYKFDTNFKKLFVWAHGGSVEHVRGVEGLIEGESRDPDFKIVRDGEDIVRNVLLYTDPNNYHIQTKEMAQGSEQITLYNNKSDEGFKFFHLNKYPFVSKIIPYKVFQRDAKFTSVSSGYPVSNANSVTAPNTYIEIEYQVYFDAKDPDDLITGDSMFGDNRDKLNIRSVELLGDDKRYRLVDIGSKFIFNPTTKVLSVKLRVYDGLALADELTYDGVKYTAGPGEAFLYVDSFHMTVPLKVDIVDSTGNEDFVTFDLLAEYQYGKGAVTQKLISYNNETAYFNQWDPWLILPVKNSTPKNSVVYFYETDKCKINFSRLQPFNTSKINDTVLPDRIPLHYQELYPGVLKAIIEVLQEDKDVSFGFDSCCPSKELMEKYRSRGICASELCCLPVYDLGNSIRFIEKGEYNTTHCNNDPITPCKLENNYKEIGGDFWSNDTGLQFGESNLVQMFGDLVQALHQQEGSFIRANWGQSQLDAAYGVSGSTENDIEEAGGTLKVLPLFFSPNGFEIRSYDYNSDYENYYQLIMGSEARDAPGSPILTVWSPGTTLTTGSGVKMYNKMTTDMPGIFGPNWTWWDYKEVVKECDDPYTSRSSRANSADDWKQNAGNHYSCSGEAMDITNACIDPHFTDMLNISGFRGVDPYQCDPNAFINVDMDIIDLSAFRTNGCCPNLKEAMRDIINEAPCTRERCCFKPIVRRFFNQFDEKTDPRIFDQENGTGYIYDDSGNMVTVPPATIYDLGGPYRDLMQYDRIFNYQFSVRAFRGPQIVYKRSGGTAPNPELEMSAGLCWVDSKWHACSYLGLNIYTPDYLASFGINHSLIGLQPDGTRKCPTAKEAFYLMVNGTCRLDKCCLEIEPDTQTIEGAPGGGPRGESQSDCAIIKRQEVPEDDEIEVGTGSDSGSSSGGGGGGGDSGPPSSFSGGVGI